MQLDSWPMDMEQHISDVFGTSAEEQSEASCVEHDTHMSGLEMFLSDRSLLAQKATIT